MQLAEQRHVKRERILYVIRNDRLDPDWSNTDRRIMDIAGRSISSLIHTQGIGDLIRIYLTTKRDDVSFNLAYIPPNFNAPHKEEFDTDYMRAFYEHAYNLAVNGYQWHKAAPGYEED